jgi:hypothetical protein
VSRVETIGDSRRLSGLSRYRFRADGEVISLWGQSPRVLRGGTDKDGYRKFVLIDDDGERRYVRRCSAQCEAWHGPRPEGQTVRHKDGTRDNDSPANLAWATHAENCHDKVMHGTAQRGEQSGTAKISEATARAIKANLHRRTPELAAELGVSRHIVNNIRRGCSWGWL